MPGAPRLRRIGTARPDPTRQRILVNLRRVRREGGAERSRPCPAAARRIASTSDARDMRASDTLSSPDSEKTPGQTIWGPDVSEGRSTPCGHASSSGDARHHSERVFARTGLPVDRDDLGVDQTLGYAPIVSRRRERERSCRLIEQDQARLSAGCTDWLHPLLASP